MSTLEIRDLHVSVTDAAGESQQILRGVNLAVRAGQTHAIMGPNGSGKSTLAYAIAGHPKYQVTQGSVTLDGENVLAMTVDARARAGLFLAMQYPVEVPGVSVSNFLRTAVTATRGEAPKLRNFVNLYNDLMLGESGLTKLEREMIAVVVSSANRCYYCLTAHGASVRQLSGDPELGEMLVMNWRTAPLPARQRALLEFAHKLAAAPAEVGPADRDALRSAGWSERDVWDAASVTGLFSFTNRLATAVDMMPNPQYHAQGR